jgi:Kef-type K+ transport system membrane component KefB
VLGGRLLLRPALRWIARSETPEIFTAASLLLVVATAALMQSVGLSMALGAFLAGVLLAESEYRRELETDLEPFKGLLLGLFFIAVGMSIDFAVVRRSRCWWPAWCWASCSSRRWCCGPWPHHAGAAGERPVFVMLLAQGGEFGFVVFQAALGRRDRRADLVAAGGGGGAVDAADAAAAAAVRPLVAPRLAAARPGPTARPRSASRSTRPSSSAASAATGRSWAGCSMPTA